MRTGKLNTESWHYWLYEQGSNSGHSYKELTICNYPWLFGREMLFVAFVVTILLAIFIFALEPYVVGIMSLVHGYYGFGFFWDNPGVWQGSILFQGCIALAAGGSYLKGYWDAWREDVNNRKSMEYTPPTEPATGFIKLCIDSYRAFKDKTCMKLERHTPGEKE